MGRPHCHTSPPILRGFPGKSIRAFLEERADDELDGSSADADESEARLEDDFAFLDKAFVEWETHPIDEDVVCEWMEKLTNALQECEGPACTKIREASHELSRHVKSYRPAILAGFTRVENRKSQTLASSSPDAFPSGCRP